MVWGKAPIYVVPECQTINTEYYLKNLEETVILWVNACYGEHQWLLIQDSDPRHVSKKATTYIWPQRSSLF